MKHRIAHLTDLHFGEARPQDAERLAADVLACDPEVVVVSGDLTQRARPGEFAAAMAFLEGLRRPLLVVPGNHDIPNTSLLERFLAPKRRWRQARDAHGLPRRVDLPGLRLIALDTVSRAQWHLDWSAGAITTHRLAVLARDLGQGAGPPTIVVCHHPLRHAPWARYRGMPRGARRTIRLLREQGVAAVLCGHLHKAEVTPLSPTGPLQVMGPSGLSRRGGRPMGWNLIEIEGEHLHVATREMTPRGWQVRAQQGMEHLPIG